MKGMVKHNVHASVKDEKLVALRREQMIKGAVQLFKQKDSRVQQRERLQKRLDLVSEHYMNTFVRKMTCYI